jgi:hypothetical protein
MTAGLGGPATDTELAAQFKRDPEMFTAVYDRYIRDIYRYVADGPENRVINAVTAERLQPQLARAITRLSSGERDVILLVAERAQPRGSVGSTRHLRRHGPLPAQPCPQKAPGPNRSGGSQ